MVARLLQSIRQWGCTCGGIGYLMGAEVFFLWYWTGRGDRLLAGRMRLETSLRGRG